MIFGAALIEIRRYALRLAALGVLCISGYPSFAAPLQGARITHIVKDVKTVDEGKPPRPSNLNELVDGGRAVRTGIESRTELLFGDQTLTRLGPNSHFTFSDGNRDMSVSKGSFLLQVPKGVGGAKIQTAAVTAAITGTTIIFEIGPLFTTLFVIEGKCLLTANADRQQRRQPVTSGQMVRIRNNATEVPSPSDFNLENYVRDSVLLGNAWGVGLDRREIGAAIAEQNRRRNAGIGTLRVEGLVLVNKLPKPDGTPIRPGDVVQTKPGQTAEVVLPNGGRIFIYSNTRIRIGGGGVNPATPIVIYGRAETQGLSKPPGELPDENPLPNLTLYGVGTLPIGGSSAPNGRVLSLVLPGGFIGFFDATGRLIHLQ